MAGKLLILKFIMMKKKIIIASASVLFAVASVLNVNMLQSNKAGDVSLDAIAVMAQATEEASLVTGWLYDVFGGRWKNNEYECEIHFGEKNVNSANASAIVGKTGGKVSVKVVNGVYIYSIKYDVNKCGSGRGNCWYSEDC